jgi:hypothetical protein
MPPNAPGRAALARMRAKCDAAGARMLAVLIPTKEVVWTGDRRRTIDRENAQAGLAHVGLPGYDPRGRDGHT